MLAKLFISEIKKNKLSTLASIFIIMVNGDTDKKSGSYGYHGDLKDGKYHGHGKYSWFSGDRLYYFRYFKLKNKY